MTSVIENSSVLQNAMPVLGGGAEQVVLQSPRSLDLKSPEAYRTIAEVSDNLSVPQHVLRFWESKFTQIRPMKRGGGRRYYRPEDILVLKNIKELLYQQGFTIKGAQRMLRSDGALSSLRRVAAVPSGVIDSHVAEHKKAQAVQVQKPQSAQSVGAVENSLLPELRQEMEDILKELKTLRAMLHQVGV